MMSIRSRHELDGTERELEVDGTQWRRELPAESRVVEMEAAVAVHPVVDDVKEE